jgi:hypothetical protein
LRACETGEETCCNEPHRGDRFSALAERDDAKNIRCRSLHLGYKRILE